MSERPVIHLVDDDEAIRHSASFMLRAAGYRVETWADGVKFLDAFAGVERGCILLDVQMPIMNGLAVQEELARRGADMPIVILTGHGDVAMAVQAMKAGASDFVEKPYEKAVLLAAIETAFEHLRDSETSSRLAASASGRISRLTGRERDVLDGLARGLTNKEIAKTFDISPRTVEIHRSNLMAKLEVDSLSAALRLAFAAGY